VLISAEKLLSTVRELLVDRKEAAFYLVGGELFFETLSVSVDQSLSLLMEQLAGMDIGGIAYKPGLTQEELVRLAALLNRDAASIAARGGIQEAAAAEQIAHVELHRVLLVDQRAGGDIKKGKKKASELFLEAVETVKELVQAVHLDKAASMRRMNSVVQAMVDTVLENRDALMGLTSIKMYDEYTFAHSVNTSILATALGTFLSFEKPQVAALGVAGLLHDIGKVKVPHEIINKPGKPTEEEWEAIKRHPVEGALLLSDIPGISRIAMVAAFEHHQHDNERGYPKAEGPLRQHLFSQVIALCDAYDALTAARVYYSVQTPPDHAVRILLKQRGTTFHAILVKAFVNMVGLFPIGTVLKLDTGELGLVTHQTHDLMRPRVLLLRTFDGTEQDQVSLLETSGGRYKRSAVGAVNPHTAKIDIKQYLD
jgi:HD-GYP domain-containing protein (c-di-GMP phosphodiesterase class II)